MATVQFFAMTGALLAGWMVVRAKTVTSTVAWFDH
jgi:hypothetical protein